MSKAVNIDDLSDEEKLQLLRELGKEVEGGKAAVQDMDIEGEVTFRVLDENQEEKRVETEKL